MVVRIYVPVSGGRAMPVPTGLMINLMNRKRLYKLLPFPTFGFVRLLFFFSFGRLA
jgi:hypothetical protein